MRDISYLKVWLNIIYGKDSWKYNSKRLYKYRKLNNELIIEIRDIKKKINKSDESN